MKIAIVSHLFPTASMPLNGIFVAEQANAISSLGHEVVVLSPQWRERPQTAPGIDLPVRYGRLRWHRWLPSAVNVLAAERSYRRWLEERLREERPDVVHGHYGFPDAVAVIRAARSVGIPTVVTLHGSDVNRQLQRPLIGRILASWLAKADAIVGVSPAMRNALAAVSPRLAEALVVVPNGFDDTTISYAKNVDREYLLFVGGLREVKRPLLMVEAYARTGLQTTVPLWIAGDGDLRARLETRISELGLEDSVKLLGEVPHSRLNDLYSRAIALVLPSAAEGMPIVILEALASGVPVVATAVGAVPSLVTEAQDGFVVDPDDIWSLADAMLAAVRSDWDRDAIANRGSGSTWRKNAQRMAEIYESVRSFPRLKYVCLQTTREGQASHAHVHGIVSGLRNTGWRVDLVQPTPRIRAGALRRAFNSLTFGLMAGRLLDGADMVYVRDHPLALPFLRAAHARGIPTVLELNGMYDELFIQYPVTRLVRWAVRGGARARLASADGVVAVTEGLADYARGFGATERVVVVPNAADTDRFTPSKRTAAEPYAAYVGVLTAWQGIDSMLAAAGDSAWPEGLSLRIAGEGPLRGRVKAAARASGGRIEYAGRLPYQEVPGFLASAVCALSVQNDVRGLGEHSPLKMFEAMACGVPTVVSDFPGQADVIRACDAGLAVDPGDSAAIASAVSRIWSDAEHRSSMGESARRCAVARHSWQVRAEATAEFLRGLLDGERR